MMERDELLRRLDGFEWTDLEVKEARQAVPKSAYETVSAFSNTAGGSLVFGVKQANGKFEIVGVLDVDGVQNDFLSTLNNGQKTSRRIVPVESVTTFEGKPVLVFYIPELSRSQKPLHLEGDLKRSFVRRGGSDFKCSEEELRRFIRDASAERHDGGLVEEDVESCFDSDTMRWYRGEYARQNAEALSHLSDVEFLHHCGLVRESKGTHLPTCGAVLLFGTPAAVSHLLPRPVVDFQVVATAYDEERGEQRWDDRLLIEDVNLFSAWRALLERFLRHTDTPFSLDSTTMTRQDQPPDYVAFREATINLLVHQDYGDHARKGSIRLFKDRTVFFNPGDAFATAEELLESGEHELRNPRVIKAFRRIGLSEQAGTGVRSIFQSWRKLGRVPPVLENDKARKTFSLALLREPLLTERQLLLQTQMGLKLDDSEAAVFALALRQDSVSLLDIRKATGGTAAASRGVADRLRAQVLLETIASKELGPWRLAAHLAELLSVAASTETDQAARAEGDLVTDQAPRRVESMVTDQADGETGSLVSEQARPKRVLLELSETQRSILLFCESPRTMAELMKHLGFAHRAYFRTEHLQPLLDARLVGLQFPDSPTHPGQKYLLTEAGLSIASQARQTATKEDR